MVQKSLHCSCSLIGYEPKFVFCQLKVDLEAMAQRTMSLPPLVNPFWSLRAKEEAELRVLRPVDLPPVPGGENDDVELSGEIDGSSRAPMEDGSVPVRDGRQRRGRSRESGPLPFETPVSWTSHRPREVGPLGMKSEGEMPREKGQREVEDIQPTVDGLQRELEKQVVYQLHVENQRLREELGRLQAGNEMKTTPSSWSAVTPDVEGARNRMTHAPPRSRSPTRRTKEEKGSLRFTPGGTQVPAGEPPMEDSPMPPQLPEWPAFLQHYETCEEGGPCHNRMGPPRVEVLREGNGELLFAKEFGRGEAPRYLYDPECGRGEEPRYGRDKEWGRGARSRYEEGLVQDRVEKKWNP